MKLISWNVNGLRACLTHGFAESFAALDADIFSVQETKMQPGQADFAPDGYTEYTYSAEKKGYSGTACWCREQPLAVTTGIGIEQHDHEGRVLTLEYPGFWLVNCYTPNSQDGLKRLDYRMEWEDAFRAYLLALDAKKPVILCGDLNVAHREIDIKNDKTNHMSAGFTDQERGKMTELLDAGFADSFRVLHPDEVKYSWWSYRFHAREKNAGWRIDYFIVSRRIADKIRAAEIHNEIFGSDHCPVELDIDLYPVKKCLLSRKEQEKGDSMLKSYLLVFFVSMVPLIELRGAIPIGLGMGLPILPTYLVCVVGNMIPVPFIYLFARKFLIWGYHKPLIGPICKFCIVKGEKGGRALEAKAGRGLVVALLLFVGIPLPGTGAWTGTLAGSILDMKFKDVVKACMGGVLLAGIIMGLASAGLLGALSTLFLVG